MKKAVTVIGCILWILGIVFSIIGMNVRTDAGQWMGIAGNIAFFIGLGITGTVWLMNKKGEKDS